MKQLKRHQATQGIHLDHLTCRGRLVMVPSYVDQPGFSGEPVLVLSRVGRSLSIWPDYVAHVWPLEGN